MKTYNIYTYTSKILVEANSLIEAIRMVKEKDPNQHVIAAIREDIDETDIDFDNFKTS